MAEAPFISLAALLRQPNDAQEPVPAIEPAPACSLVVAARPTAPDLDEALRAARCFRAALADALDARLEDLLRDLASDVLARELMLAPADIAAILRRLIDERTADGPLCVRVAAEDAALPCALPLVVDPALRPGDAVLVCAHGSIDARLGVRLADILEARA